MGNWQPWAWAILSLAFTIAEVFTAGFFLLCFGIGAAAAALAGFLGFPVLMQFGVFIVVSLLVLALIRPFANRVTNPIANQIGVDRVIGQQAVVLESIDPAAGCGVVRVEHEKWSADSADGTPIAAGTTVLVISVEGTHLKVQRLAQMPLAA